MFDSATTEYMHVLILALCVCVCVHCRVVKPAVCVCERAPDSAVLLCQTNPYLDPSGGAASNTNPNLLNHRGKPLCFQAPLQRNDAALDARDEERLLYQQYVQIEMNKKQLVLRRRYLSFKQFPVSPGILLFSICTKLMGDVISKQAVTCGCGCCVIELTAERYSV